MYLVNTIYLTLLKNFLKLHYNVMIVTKFSSIYQSISNLFIIGCLFERLHFSKSSTTSRLTITVNFKKTHPLLSTPLVFTPLQCFLSPLATHVDTAALLSSSSATLQEGGRLLITPCTVLVFQYMSGHDLEFLDAC